MEQQLDPQSAQAPAEPAAPAAQADPFAIDENALSILSPEQRASLEPILDGWKKRASDEIKKREEEYGGKLKPYEEKAQALDKLTQYRPFVEWWTQQQNQAKAGASSSQQQQISQTKPQDIASPQEWQEAVIEASNGDGAKLQALQARMLQSWAMPVLERFNEKQQALETKIAIDSLFSTHPDAKELDTIGLDPKTKEGTSLLEIALDWAEKQGKSVEDGYRLARSWADSFRVQEQQKAMGMVQEKKQAVTAGPSTQQAGKNIVTVGSADELIKRSLEAQLSGQKDLQFVIQK